VLYALQNRFAAPDFVYFVVSGEVVIFNVMGGIGTLVGPIVGAAFFLGLREDCRVCSPIWRPPSTFPTLRNSPIWCPSVSSHCHGDLHAAGSARFRQALAQSLTERAETHRSGKGALSVRVAVDIGGTFTDIVVASSAGVLHESKLATTPQDPSRAVVTGLAALLKELALPPEQVVEVLHGTTVGSNTILQKTGARTGLITTRGFRDVLEIGRIRMPDMFDLSWDKPKPLVPRRFRLEVGERVRPTAASLSRSGQARSWRPANG
jgi:hypothetical protein